VKNQFKVPVFVSEEFNKLDIEQKKEFINRYRRWEKNEFTVLFLEGLEKEYKSLVQEDEEKSDFVSWFSFSYKTARNRAQRLQLKSLINKIKSK